MLSDDDTIFLGIYGSIQPYPWLARDESGQWEEDAYSLFSSRAEAMGWSSSEPSDRTRDLWAMNEAGDDWSKGDAYTRVAWYQVMQSSPPGEPLPVQPLLACAGDSLARVGTLNLEAVQLLLPLHASGDGGSLVNDRGWLNTVRTDARVSVRVTLDSGDSDQVSRQAEGVAATLQDLGTRGVGVSAATSGFEIDWVSSDETLAVELTPPAAELDRIGKGHHRLTIQGTIPEWSFEVIGRTTSLIVEACRDNHVTAKVLTDLRRV